MIRRIVLFLILGSMATGIGSCGLGYRGCACYKPDEWWRGERVQGSRNLVTVERGIDGVIDIDLATIGTLYIDVGPTETLVIKGEDNIIDHVISDVERGTLTITNEEGYYLEPRRPLEYRLTVRNLRGIMLSSAGDAYLPDVEAPHFRIDVSSSGDLTAGKITGGSVDVRLNSSGDVEIERLECGRLDADLSSSGDLVIAGGSVGDQGVSVSSSGSYDARHMKSERADIDLSSSGNAYVTVTKNLDARMSSSGSVYYAGNAKVKQRTTSSGTLRRLDV